MIGVEILFGILLAIKLPSVWGNMHMSGTHLAVLTGSSYSTFNWTTTKIGVEWRQPNVSVGWTTVES
jgi:hypothetical protein